MCTKVRWSFTNLVLAHLINCSHDALRALAFSASHCSDLAIIKKKKIIIIIIVIIIIIIIVIIIIIIIIRGKLFIKYTIFVSQFF